MLMNSSLGERSQDPLALVANHQMTPSYFNTYQSSYNNPQFQQQFSPSQSPQYGSNHPTQHYSATYPSTPHAITYPSAPYLNAYSSTVPKIEYIGRQSSYAAGTSGTKANTSGTRGNYSGQQRVVKCFNCQGEGHMARQCPKLKRKSDATWFREKVLLAEAQGNVYQANNLDAYDSDCDEISTAKAVFMAKLSSYGSNDLSEIRPMLYDENVIAKETNVISNANFEETLMLEEDNFGKRFIPQRELSDEQALHPITDQSASSPIKIVALRELPKEKVFVITTLKNDLRKLKGKDIVDNATTIALRMFKLDPIILAPKVKNNREAHEYYLKHTMEQAAILRKPSGNTKNDRIPRTPSSNEKNKVEVQSRKVKSSLSKWNSDSKNICNEHVKLPVKGAKALCSVYSDCLFDANHAMCLIDHVNSMNVVQIVFWYLDSECSKHMTGDRSQLTNFVHKYLGTVKFGNDQVAKIIAYGDYQIGNVTISRVYYVEGLGHNLFSVGSQGTNLYSLSIGNMMASSPICLLSKATKTKSWLWHRRLSYLNFGAINHLARHGLVRVLPRLKFEKDHLCFACAMGKSKKQSHKPKSEDTSQEKLYLIHMDLYRPMHNGTELVNQTLRDYYEQVCISNETSVAQTPQQNGVVERRIFSVAFPVHVAEASAPVESTGLPSSTTVDQDAPSPSTSQTTPQSQSQTIPLSAKKESHDLEVAHMSNDPYFVILIPEIVFEESSTSDVISTTVHSDAPISKHLRNLENKARLVAHGYRCEDRIDFVESFAPVARLEVVQIVLAFFAHMSMIVYQMDVNKAILNGILHEEISQSPKGIFLNQSKYALESLKKYEMESCDPVDTPMVEKSKLDKDTQRKAVDPTHYRGMVGTLMYLTSSRPDLVYDVCMCAQYQDRPTKKHLHAVKRIFRYLRGTVNRGLWYAKDSSTALIAFADVDHAGCQDTRHSTSGSM
uniref:Ribonuclease H-like domain-containing protein n=1 Tax=Tanacetum cinerariifolium TaxID=118510 RepID=A0A6L2MLT0_TANCI|nr:ribonuclease H-like domain-containing protein [Tanacetum cinerariifolium]